MSVVPINKDKAEWSALAALEYAKEHVGPETPLVVLYLDKDNNSQWSAANLDNHTMLWILETTKFGLIAGD